jgi:hypothetical protein
MRYLIAAVAGVVIIALAALVPVIWQQPAAEVHIRMSSQPFPLAVGSNTLLISLVTEDGAPVDGAAISVASHRDHPGMLPMTGRAGSSTDGQYRVPITWPMMGPWRVDVTAELPNERGVIQEQFEVFVYAIRPAGASQAEYRSVRENEVVVSAHPERELWILIPQGTQAMLTEGHQIMPDEIRLKLDGPNTLVIRNDDLTDHMIGPFFVRPGETIRQEFTQPAVFQGTCTISRSGDISIIVEG